MSIERRYKLLSQGLVGNCDFALSDLSDNALIRWDATEEKWVIYTAPTITGSRGGNAALTDLLTELDTLGLIVDSTT